MAQFSSRVGIRMQQLGAGTLRPTGARVAGAEEPFSFTLELANPSLRDFLRGPHEVRRVGGQVQWTVRGGRRALPISAGHMELFRPGPEGTRTFDLAFTFDGPDGAPLHLSAQKVLRDDRGVDVLEAGEDLSRLQNVRVERAGALLYTGELSVRLEQTLEEAVSLSFPGAASAEEEAAAVEAFFSLYNGYLAELYDAMPLLLPRGRFLGWTERQLLLLAARAVLPPDAAVPPQGIVLGLDRYLERAQLPVLERLRPVLPLLAPAGVVALLAQLIPGRLVRRRLAGLLEGEAGPAREAAELLHALVMTPYYAHPRVDAELGYRRAQVPPPEVRPEALPTRRRPERTGYDVLIAGSGPAGSLLAARLTAAGRRVLLLEAGRQHPAAQLGDRELEALGALYKEGGLQQAMDPVSGRTVPVLQARALGGGALVNNAVNFRLPPEVLAHWQARWDFPFTREQLDAAYDAVARELHIVPVRQALTASARPNPAHALLAAGLGQPLQECLVNLAGCIGCGYCNLGCAVGAKQNALTVHLRQAAATGLLDIVPGAEVQRLVVERGGRVAHALVRYGDDGTLGKACARHFVLACGAVGSSRVLHATDGLRAEARALVGTRLSANVGAPVHAFTRTPVEAARALPLAHAYRPAGDGPDFLVETWFNAPATLSLSMPGFLDTQLQRMRGYSRLLSAGALVGTTPGGRVDAEGRLLLPVTGEVREALARGVRAIAEAFLHARNAGEVEEVVLRTREGVTARSLAELAARFPPPEALVVGTGHPQGGNPLSASVRHGVVDGSFRVAGLENASVCDASVFPDCARVNPQWTVLALAHLCAGELERAL